MNKEELEKILGQAILHDLVSRGHIKTTENMKPSFIYGLYPDRNDVTGIEIKIIEMES